MAKKHKPEPEADIDPKAPVIELAAEEVKDMDRPAAPAPESDATAEMDHEAGGEPHPSQQQTTPAASRFSAWLWGAAALVALAAIGGAWAYKSYGARFWPSDEMTAMAARLETLEAGSKTAGDQLRGLGAAVDELRADAGRLGETAMAAQAVAEAALQTATATQETARNSSDRIAGLESEIAVAQKTVDALKAALAAQPAGDGGPASVIDMAALGELQARVEAVEKDLAELKARSGSGGSETVTLLSQALADLKAKVTAGVPFQDEMQKIAELVPAAPGLDVLARLAANGVPSPAMLGEEATRLAGTLAAPSPVAAEEADGSYWQAVLGALGSVVKIRKVGETDWRDVATQAGAAAAEGKLSEALALAAGEGAMPDGLRVWREQVQARIDAETAIEELSSAVLRQISAIGGAP